MWLPRLDCKFPLHRNGPLSRRKAQAHISISFPTNLLFAFSNYPLRTLVLIGLRHAIKKPPQRAVSLWLPRLDCKFPLPCNGPLSRRKAQAHISIRFTPNLLFAFPNYPLRTLVLIGLRHAIKKPPRKAVFFVAASPGFEPRYQHPECRVLPLDDEALNSLRYLLSFL